jgi:hypothetical protein
MLLCREIKFGHDENDSSQVHHRHSNPPCFDQNLKKFCRLYKVNDFMRENISSATRPILCNAICQAKESYVETQKMMHIEIDEQIDVPSSNDDTPVILQPGSAQWHDIHNKELIVLQEVDAEYLSNGQKQSVSCEI